MADDQLDSLEKKITILENIVFGTSDKDILYPKGFREREECIDSLYNVHTKTTEATEGKRRINSAFKQLPEIQKLLDHSYADELTTSSAAKEDIILAEEDFILKHANLLEKMQTLDTSIETEHLKNLPGLSSKLQKLSQIQINQQDKTAAFTDEVSELLSAYNNIISIASKQFVHWDEVLTALEKGAKKK